MKSLVDEMALADRGMAPASVWTEVTKHIYNKYADNAIMNMLTRQQTINRVNYTRQGGQTADRQRDIEEMDLALTTDRMSPFLLFNTPIFEGLCRHRLTGWAHPGLFSILKSPAIHIFVDTTFSVVPDPYKQLLIILVKEAAHDMYLPACYVLMIGKSQFLYRLAFHMLEGVLCSKIRPSAVYCDFEKGLISSLKGGTIALVPCCLQ